MSSACRMGGARPGPVAPLHAIAEPAISEQDGPYQSYSIPE
jgi:hypothetical protein